MWYLLYARTGKEFEAAQEIRDMGHEAICEPCLKFMRSGKDRRAHPVEEPYLPNYVFAEIPAEAFLSVMGIKPIASTATPISGAEMRRVRDFQVGTQDEYAEAKRVAKNREAVCEYRAGQAVRFLDGRFGERLLKFRKMVERSHDAYPKVVIEAEMMGRVITMEADPLDVRSG